jgi:hypothetical protein
MCPMAETPVAGKPPCKAGQCKYPHLDPETPPCRQGASTESCDFGADKGRLGDILLQ